MARRTIDLNHLEYFFEVARHRGFSRAQSALGVGQPSLSKAVKSLEGSLGVALLERHGRGVSLTPAGQEVFALAQEIFQTVHAITERASSARTELKGDLKVGANEHVATYLLAPILARMRHEHSRVTPRIFTGPTHLMVREIVEGRQELGLFFLVERSSLIERLELAKVPCVLVVAPGRGGDPGVVQSFIGSRELDEPSNRAFPTVKMLRRKHPDTSIRLSCNSLEAHKSLVKAGCGVSILPAFMVEQELRSGALERFAPTYTYEATLELVVRRGKVLSGQAQAFIRLLKQFLKTRFTL
jgi:DNA-binding transcriptional LysR family regulator